MHNYDHDSETSPTEVRTRPRRQRRKRAPQNNHDYLPNQRSYDETAEDGTISNPIALANQTSFSQSKTSVEYLSRESTIPSTAPPAYPGPGSKNDRRSQHANRRLTKMSNTSEELDNGNERRRPRRKVKSTQRLPRSVSEEVLAAENRNAQNSRMQSAPPEEGRISQQTRSTDRTKGDREDESQRPRKSRQREHPPKKKRPPKAPNAYSSENEDNYQGDEEFSEIFHVDKEDIVQPSESTAKVSSGKVTSISKPAIPSSQPSNVVYIEKKGGQGFTSEHKSKLNKPIERTIQLRDVDRGYPTSRLDFIYSIHHGFHKFSTIAQGLLAGIAISQCIFVYSLSREKVTTLLEQYDELALPYQSLYYILLAICVVSIFDRYIDMSPGWSQFFSILFSKPSRAIALVSYLFAFIFSISLAQIDDRISLHKLLPELWKKDADKHIATWKIINLLRVIGSVLGWIMVAIAPDDDQTAAAIKKNIEKEKCEKVYSLSTQAKIKPI